MGGGSGGQGTVFRIANPTTSPTFSVIYSFAGGDDGGHPVASLMQASDGDLYGTTLYNGRFDEGVVFRISDLSTSPRESVIYTFTGGSDGGSPRASLIQASDGNLYGTTQSGGSVGAGAVFKVSNLEGSPTETVIYSFGLGADGGNPSAPLIQASDGNLYGTTDNANSGSRGTVFKISNLSGSPVKSLIHTFSAAGDGDGVVSAVIQASDGNLYGTTGWGGSNGAGTVFKIGGLSTSPTESVIQSFKGGIDGSGPSGSLIEAFDESLYGMTTGGGANNTGTVFKIGNLSGVPVKSVIHDFTEENDGALPVAALIQIPDGDLYGATETDGSNIGGTVFRVIDPSGLPAVTVVHVFESGSDGSIPSASLIQASDGNLYGTTQAGGSGGGGTVFRISNLLGPPIESVVHNFSGGSDGAGPAASLIQASDGNLYGTTELGGANNAGTVFRISDLSGTPTEMVIYSFRGSSDGGDPQASLIEASDGNLYGTTIFGGLSNCVISGGTCGTVFKISNLSGTPTESVIYSFTGGSDGALPAAPLIEASDGDLYGTTQGGGIYDCRTIQLNPIGCGTVFKIRNLSTSPIESVIYSFTGESDGESPQAALLQASDGNLYGTIPGAAFGVFKISNFSTSPSFSVVYTFKGGNDGAYPVASLIQASDGALYGTTVNGGIGFGGIGFGTIFKITNPATSPAESVVYRFTGEFDGAFPESSLIQASDGKLYGTTPQGGSADAGVVFSLDLRTTRPPLRLTPAPPSHPAPIRETRRSTPPVK